MLKHQENCWMNKPLGDKPYKGCTCRGNYLCDGLPRWVLESLDAEGATHIKINGTSEYYSMWAYRRDDNEWESKVIYFSGWFFECLSRDWRIYPHNNRDFKAGVTAGLIVPLWDALEKETGTISFYNFYDELITEGPLFLPPLKYKLEPQELEQLEHLYKSGCFVRPKGMRQKALDKIKSKLVREGLVTSKGTLDLEKETYINEYKPTPVVKWYFENEVTK